VRESPETLIVPYNIPKPISSTAFINIDLVLCERCGWCCSSFNTASGTESCPLCRKNVSRIPISIDEVYRLRFDEKKGTVIEFSRKTLVE